MKPFYSQIDTNVQDYLMHDLKPTPKSNAKRQL